MRYIDKNRNAQIIFFILMFILCLFAALRSIHVGNDTFTYYNIYKNIIHLDLYNSSFKDVVIKERIEPAYTIINYICYSIFDSFQVLLAICALFTYYGYWNFIRKYSYSLLFSLLVFFCFRYSDSTMNIIRQEIAIVITLRAYDEIRTNNLYKYLLFVGIACLFHHSAIFFLPAWWICKMNLNKKSIIISIIIAVSLMSAIKDNSKFIITLMGDYASYMDSNYVEEGKIAPTINIIIYSIALLFVWLSHKNKNFPIEYKGDYNRMCNLIFTGIMILILSLSNALISRVAAYYYVFILILIPNAIKKLENRTNKLFFSSLIITLFIIYYIVIITFRPNWNRVYPYSFFWEIN